MPQSGSRQTSGQRSSGGGVPMSERQQMALLMQMTPENKGDGGGGGGRGRGRNERGETPLHIAAIKGDVIKIRNLLEHGADPNVSDFAGWSPLHEACNRGWVEACRLLLARGANVNAKGFSDVTPLHDACINGHIEVVKLLLESGADPKLRNSAGKTAHDVATPLIKQLIYHFAEEAIREEYNAEGEENKEDEMRRLPTQGKEKCGSPRVTLRIHQLKEKKEKAKGGLAAPDHDTYSGMEGKPGSEEVLGCGKEGGGGEEPGDGSEAKENVPEQPGGNEVAEPDPPTAQVKRTHSTEEETDDSRKKRRKEDSSRGKSGSNSGGSPKSVVGGESEGEDNKSVGSPGPKVPPLKIVISGANLEEQGTRNGKNGSGRHHLPYVVASSTEGEGSPPAQLQQDSETSLSSAPTDEQRSHQRVLRSHRSGNGGSSSGASGNPSPLAPSGTEGGSPRQVSPTPVVEQNTLNPLEAEEKPAVMSDAPESPRQTVELHPRKRKMKPKDQPPPDPPEPPVPQSHPTHEQQVTNSYQLFLNIRKQIDQKRKGLFPVQPKPPQGFKDYLMNRCTYVLAGNSNNRIPPASNAPPASLPANIRDLYIVQEKERHRLLMQHVIEKEKLVLSVEQEILRVHGRAARALANQSLPFSVCTILRDEEVYSAITPEQEEKDRIARSRYNGRLFISWLRDVDDKWEKIKEAMLLRHHNEAESLHAVQKMDWEWKMKELGICEFKSKPVIDDTHVPMVHVSDDFDLLPA